MPTSDEYRSLVARSGEFLDTAEFQIGRGFYTVAAFSLHQSLELFLKAKLFSSGVEYPRTHSIKTLLEILSEVFPEACSDSANELINAHLLEYALLEEAYITARYYSRDFSGEEVARLMKAVRESVKRIGETC